jgi:hypothetical protein
VINVNAYGTSASYRPAKYTLTSLKGISSQLNLPLPKLFVILHSTEDIAKSRRQLGVDQSLLEDYLDCFSIDRR